MQFELTPDFSAKVFQKVGSLAGQDIDFSDKTAQVDFCRGFVEFLEKEAEMSPEMAFGFLNCIYDRGAEWMGQPDKTAGIGSLIYDFAKKNFPGATEKVQKWVQPIVDRGIENTAKKYVGDIGDTLKDFGGKAWEYLKSPEFLTGVAPYLIGGLGGALIPRLFSKEPGMISTGLGAAGGALLGKYLTDNRNTIGQLGDRAKELMRQNSKWVQTGQ